MQIYFHYRGETNYIPIIAFKLPLNYLFTGHTIVIVMIGNPFFV